MMRRLFLVLLIGVGGLYSADVLGSTIKCGADRVEIYLPNLIGKKIGVVAHPASMIYVDRLSKKVVKEYNIKSDVHIVDFLVVNGIDVECVFAPEHGFRGTEDAGAVVKNSIDSASGVKICSLYDGKTGKPSHEILSQLDLVIFDLQDVGLRFYTYLTTMAKMMDACAEVGVNFMVLDRPNPNGHYVDGPILDMKYRSSVGWLPIPIVHGMTLGELAHMIIGEGWLESKNVCNLNVIECENYTHQSLYSLPKAPSPNLPNMRSVYLYPSLCYFEATPISVGRGTEFPFQCWGHPNLLGYKFDFTPISTRGASNPPQIDTRCWGVDLRKIPSDSVVFNNGVDLTYLIEAYNNLHIGNHFFRPFFEKLIGVDWVRKMIINKKNADEIKVLWQNDVNKFKNQRSKYLLYKE